MNRAFIRYFLAVMVAAIAALVSYPEALAAVTPMPPTITVSRGQAASRSITYRLQGIDVGTDTVSSPGGQFYVGADLVGQNSMVLTARMVHSTAVVTEPLTIPASVIEAALARHTNTITYQREFVGGVFPAEGVEVSIVVMSEAASDFEIKRMELYFADRRAEVTVGRNQKGLKAYVDIRYAGTGLMQAFWEVDGRVLATVNQYMTFAGNVTLESPDIPALPTFETGTHTVRFVVTSPSPEITVPTIVYYVLPEEAGSKLLELVSPQQGQVLEGLPYDFRWTGSGLADTYVVRYYEDPDAAPVFSAYTRQTSYSLPKFVLGASLLSGRLYRWDVTAYGEDGEAVGRSQMGSFNIK